MAPEAANQKRKRGRPPNASREEGDASASQSRLTKQGRLATASQRAGEAEADEAPRPRKRGRPRAGEGSPGTQLAPAQPSRGKRKHNPSPVPQTNGNEEEARNENPETKVRRKRARLQPPEANDEDDVETRSASKPVEQENAPPKKRGRPRKKPEAAQDKAVGAEEADDEDEGNSSLLRRSGRVRQSLGASDGPAKHGTKPSDEQTSAGRGPKARAGRGRPPSDRQNINETAQDPPQPKKKRGRVSINRSLTEENANREPQPQPQKHTRTSLTGESTTLPPKEKGKKSRGQQSHDPEAPTQEEDQAEKGQPPKSTRRGRPPKTQSHPTSRPPSPDSAASPPRYRHLATRTHRVPRNVIESKWTSLEAPAISSVTTLLQSASRPVLLRLTNPQRHGYATAALNAVSNQLRSKISRGMPFPPATTSTRREEEFEFERTISGIQALESQLDPLLHSVELLKREKARAEKELDWEYKVLRRLSSNARAEAADRRQKMKKMHVLVPERPPDAPALVDAADQFSLPADNASSGVFSDLQDEELVGLAGQVANHMESMRGNLKQIDGVSPAIEKSHALLRAALQSRLDPEQWGKTLLG
ncbi:CENP-Q, a CENPA-CAD centromere complex subunit-domain-containing protein [Durotheca rogersii]|uniref:CENP-Q, a CENPA-CAD centromere complex subunit-domain-containing protein n=1 Tax=Durotheca rogersii TaxID=419775 RepID=UPI002220C9D8|nr:CENP-Q, a CENPA-CAD centromere complex subunit-domain-containing protein [Durotheca rogersii]KAI5864431.1 CENP-Q, a CENPA-CAD centromere complex subunit-domain-containing protein [Durotheca rogersii]